jgi:murein DD-endopeptidase MepM/ murein hydrolase activator NlpD
MDQLYYLSGEKIKNLNIKAVRRTIYILTSLVTISIVINVFNVIPIFFPSSDLASLRVENKALNERFSYLSSDYNELNKKVSELVANNNELRLAANLEPLENEIGVGGAIFSESSPSTSNDFGNILAEINDYVEAISYKINFEIENHKQIETALLENNKMFDAIPAIRPAKGSYGDKFGMRNHPILKRKRMHNGLDILANTGEPVYATGDGRIHFSGRRGGMGKMIIIDHGFGYKTYYGHLSKSIVKRGKKIQRGDLIGYSGNSGLSTGPHLHYEVRHKGIALNPKNFIFEDVKLFEFVSK